MSLTEGSIYNTISKSLDAVTVDSHVLLLAFSGGPDSVCLLDNLSIYAAARNLTVGIAYVNHALRDPRELAEEEAFVRQIARKYGVDCHILHCAPGQIEQYAKERGNGIEEAARILRYRLLESCRAENKYDCILTAHNHDDVVETAIMRFFKGSGVDGLCGIKESDHYLIRPMLDVSKQDVMEFLAAKGLPYSLDTTNLEPDFTRNSMRQQLLPAIERVFPGYKKAVTQLIRKMQYTRDYLYDSLPDYESSIATTEWGVSCSIELFNEYTPYERMQLLYHMWNMVSNSGKMLPFSVIRELVDSGIRRSAVYSTKRLFMFDDTLCYVSKEAVFWNRTVVHTEKNRYLNVVDSASIVLYSGCRLMRKDVATLDADAICIAREKIFGTLVVRSYMDGDEIVFRNGTKKITKLFNDWKVPIQDRWKIPVLEDAHGIIAVLGRSFGFRDRISIEHSLPIEYKPDKMWAFSVVHVGDSVEFE